MDAQQVKEFFESVASEWDEMRSTFYSARVIDALAEHADIDTQDTVVDVGCGTGSSPPGSPHARGRSSASTTRPRC
jgi:ubiquinone/menaquinone biosynthesis C-methylase UbiE